MKIRVYIPEILLLVGVGVGLVACREDIRVVPFPVDIAYRNGFYILCEGNMGSNKATIDFYDSDADTLYMNIYPAMNPTVVKALGDVGNDMLQYGSRKYATINVSGQLEIMNAYCCHIAEINIQNCRSIVAAGGFVYVSSYAGPIDVGNPNYAQRGYVAKVDTATLKLVDTCLVGYQPDGMAVLDGKLYVANSGGYMAPRYDSTLSVIDLASFREIGRITVAPNLDQVIADTARHCLYVSSRGDYAAHQPAVYCVSPAPHGSPLALSKKCVLGKGSDVVRGKGLLLADDRIWFIRLNQVGYYDLETEQVTMLSLPNEQQFKNLYALYISPCPLTGKGSDAVRGKELYVTDADWYVNPGHLYRYRQDSVGNWQLVSHHRTGDIPGHFCR